MTTKTPVKSVSGRKIPSDKELMALPKDGYKRELLNGEIVISPAGFDHGRRIMRFAIVLGNLVYQYHLGEVFDGQTGFRMKSRDVLSPDISFVPGERLLQLGENTKGFFEGAPDLAIEFLSPGDPKKRLQEKLTQYLENGTWLAWVMDSERRTIMAHRASGAPRMLTESDELSGEDVVPGFAVSVASVFAEFDYRR